MNAHVVKSQDRIVKGRWFEPSNGRRSMPRIRTYVDFSKIEYLSTGAAVIIAASYDRMATLVGSTPPTINLDRWSHAVFSKLYELGFFEIVGLTSDVAESRYRDRGQLRTMRLLSGRALKVEEFEASMLPLWNFLLEGGTSPEEAVIALNTALSEAMTNVTNHAYPSYHTFEYRHVGKWWVTAEANRDTRELTVVIYDQGATIPVTYPRQTLPMRAWTLLESLFQASPSSRFGKDSAYIYTAMQVGMSRTDQANRGLGLANMRELIDIIGAGRMTIYSRGGVCTYEPGVGFERDTLESSVGGTLVEWTLRLP